MDNFTEFWDSLGYNRYFLILLAVLFIGHIIYVIYKSVVVMSKKQVTGDGECRGVSVIITASNKAASLKQNLDAFLSQDYPNFEVIVVDECSEDETQQVLSDFQQQYPNLRTSRIFPETKFHCTKKIAINIGVLAAQHDILLFTEINCVPDSKDWIQTMQSYFDSNTAVVIGYSNYVAGTDVINIRRFFRFLRFLKTLVMVKNRINLLGDGNNMGYRKRYYMEKRGYSRNSQIYMGYDSEMVAELSQKGSVKVVKDERARMSIMENSVKSWLEDVSYYYALKHEWPLWIRLRINLDIIVEICLYLLVFYFIFSGILHKYIGAVAILTFLIDFILINVYLRHLGQRKLFLTSFVVSLLGVFYKCYFSMYSIFTSRKWR